MLSMDASFPEQAAEGYQQCYKGSEDMTRVLMLERRVKSCR